nr:MAG TPA: hypothetical protein [Caudoviricetes sp.]
MVIVFLRRVCLLYLHLLLLIYYQITMVITL